MDRRQGMNCDVAGMLSVVLVALTLWLGLRLALIASHGVVLAEASRADLLEILLVGARLDLSVLGYALVPAVMLLPLPAPMRSPAAAAYAAVLVLLVAAVVPAEFRFIDYYGFRPSSIVLEHGADPEALRAATRYLTAGFSVVTLGVAVGALFIFERLRRLLSGVIPFAEAGAVARGLLAIGLLGVCVLAARGTLDHRPINPSVAALSSNRIANEIAGSGAFTLGYELAHWRQRDRDRLANYHSVLPWPEVAERVRTLVGRLDSFTHDSANPFVREVVAPDVGRPLNVVVVVMESFTGRLVGALGGSPALSPEFDRLAEEGVLLKRCYATGERTVQGLEAVISSFPPLPGVSVVRRPMAQSGFETLASVLARRGYDTLFLYGGQGIFDHMRGFFLGNGFQALIEEDDFDSPGFRGTWGVSDEDLFRRANRELQSRWEDDRPFLATLLTVSLHSPWEFPSERAPELPEATPVPSGFERAELANFLYADFAVGQFMREARRLPYSRDTLFVFVGDHGVHLRGRTLLPAEEYRVPALFLAPEHLRPRTIDAVASQLDIAPTIMGILGGSYRSAFFGRDVLAGDGAQGMAIMVYRKRDYGVVRGERLTVIPATGDPRAYHLQGAAEPSPATFTRSDGDTSRDGLALLQAAECLVENGLYTSERVERSHSACGGTQGSESSGTFAAGSKMFERRTEVSISRQSDDLTAPL